MSLYPVAGYLHLVAGVGLFVALGLEWALIFRLRSARTVEHARAWLSLTEFQRPIGLASLVTVLVFGLYMVVTAWGAVPWIIATLVALGLMMAFGAYNGLHIAPIERALGGQGPLSSDRLAELSNSLLLVSVHARAGILLGVLLLMKFKPDPVGAAAMIVVPLAVGLLSALLVLARADAHQADARVVHHKVSA